MQVTIKGDEIDSFTLVNVDKDSILDDMRDELPVVDSNGNEIELENISDSELTLIFKKELLIQDGVVALFFHKLVYVETKFARYLVGMDDLQTSYVYNNVFTLVTWGNCHVFNLEKAEHKTFYSR